MFGLWPLFCHWGLLSRAIHFRELFSQATFASQNNIRLYLKQFKCYTYKALKFVIVVQKLATKDVTHSSSESVCVYWGLPYILESSFRTLQIVCVVHLTGRRRLRSANSTWKRQPYTPKPPNTPKNPKHPKPQNTPNLQTPQNPNISGMAERRFPKLLHVIDGRR